jgi:hypothetical protein
MVWNAWALQDGHVSPPEPITTLLARMFGVSGEQVTCRDEGDVPPRESASTAALVPVGADSAASVRDHRGNRLRRADHVVCQHDAPAQGSAALFTRRARGRVGRAYGIELSAISREMVESAGAVPVIVLGCSFARPGRGCGRRTVPLLNA